jgi:hypothetical protein
VLEQEGGGWWGLEVLRAVTGVTDSGILHNVRLHKFFFFHKSKVAKPCWRGGVPDWRQITDRTGSRNLLENYAAAICTKTSPFP